MRDDVTFYIITSSLLGSAHIQQRFLAAQSYLWNHIVQTCMLYISWWRHQMETFSALLAICSGNSPITSEFPAQRPVTRSFDAFFDLRLNKRLSKQWRGWWFETPSCPLWRHSNMFSYWYRKGVLAFDGYVNLGHSRPVHLGFYIHLCKQFTVTKKSCIPRHRHRHCFQ